MADIFKNTLTLEDAARLTGPKAFNIMLKPAGSLCNLDCKYCYYLDKAEIYGGKEPKMSEDMLRTVVKEYIAANDVPEVTFNWHGGEPLVLGKDFYRKALSFQKEYADGKIIHNTLQTNGTLLDGEWAELFAKGDFLIGISIDGPREIHDAFRKDKGGAPTFDKVVSGIRILQRGGVQFNTMSTVNRKSEGKGVQVYEFLKSLGSRYMQFMPVVEHVKYPLKDGKPDKGARPYIVSPTTPDAVIAPWSISDIAFGKFMIEIFDKWLEGDVGNYFVNYFDAALACWCSAQPGICVFAPTCGGNAVIEHNGDFYPCDHFVYPEYKLGNIRERSIREMFSDPVMGRFGIDKRNTLPAKCRKCKWLFACNGECPKHRFSKTEKGETGLNTLCTGLQMFYSHIAPYMEKMKEYLENGQSPAYVMYWAKIRNHGK